MFPNAAAANHSIFYDSSGRARSVSDVYSVLTSRYASAAGSQATLSRDSRGGRRIARDHAVASARAASPLDNAAYLSSFPDAAPTVDTGHDGLGVDARPARRHRPVVFRSLFQAAGERTQPVSPAIHELWGNSSSLISVALGHRGRGHRASTPAASASAPQSLDLFSDRNGTFSS